jgi:hypothetical protein
VHGPDTFDFYDESALLERLSKALRRRNQEVIFLVGAPMSAPPGPGSPGVPGVEGVIELIRSEFADDEQQLAALDQDLRRAEGRRYQTAFQFLQGRRGKSRDNPGTDGTISDRAAESSQGTAAPFVPQSAPAAFFSLRN